jgi:GntR family transcriptional regulator, transcriptional repressor for pyruvate dehydrogenase complex
VANENPSLTTPKSADRALFRPAPPKRAFDEIIAQIRELIQSGDLSVGDRLPSERALAEQFSVSRNTVREALRMLEISGLVRLKRGASGGAFITGADATVVANSMFDALQLSDFSLADVTETLEGMSSMAAQAACERMTDEDLAAIDKNLELAAAMTKEGRWDEKMRVHLDFHNLLAEATGNPILVLMMRTLLDVVGRVIVEVGPTQDDTILRSRRRLVKALHRRDADAAVKELHHYFTHLHKMWLSGTYRGARSGPSSS